MCICVLPGAANLCGVGADGRAYVRVDVGGGGDRGAHACVGGVNKAYACLFVCVREREGGGLVWRRGLACSGRRVWLQTQLLSNKHSHM